MPLSMAKAGETVTVRRVGGNDSVKQHLAELGLVPGEEISVISENSGNLILHVKDSRIALDCGMANRVYI